MEGEREGMGEGGRGPRSRIHSSIHFQVQRPIPSFQPELRRRAHLPSHDARIVGIVGVEEVDASACGAELVEVLVELKDLRPHPASQDAFIAAHTLETRDKRGPKHG